MQHWYRMEGINLSTKWNLSNNDDLIGGMVAGLESAFQNIYLTSRKKMKHLGGKDCFFIDEKAKYYYEFYLPPEFQLTLPKGCGLPES